MLILCTAPLVESISSKEKDDCGKYCKIDDTDRKQSCPSEFHHLVKLESWNRPANPDKQEDEEGCFGCKDSYI